MKRQKTGISLMALNNCDQWNQRLSYSQQLITKHILIPLCIFLVDSLACLVWQYSDHGPYENEGTKITRRCHYLTLFNDSLFDLQCHPSWISATSLFSDQVMTCKLPTSYSLMRIRGQRMLIQRFANATRLGTTSYTQLTSDFQCEEPRILEPPESFQHLFEPLETKLNECPEMKDTLVHGGVKCQHSPCIACSDRSCGNHLTPPFHSSVFFTSTNALLGIMQTAVNESFQNWRLEQEDVYVYLLDSTQQLLCRLPKERMIVDAYYMHDVLVMATRRHLIDTCHHLKFYDVKENTWLLDIRLEEVYYAPPTCSYIKPNNSEESASQSAFEIWGDWVVCVEDDMETFLNFYNTKTKKMHRHSQGKNVIRLTSRNDKCYVFLFDVFQIWEMREEPVHVATCPYSAHLDGTYILPDSTIGYLNESKAVDQLTLVPL